MPRVKHKLSPQQGEMGLSQAEPTIVIKKAPENVLLQTPITDVYDYDRAMLAGQLACRRVNYYSLHQRNAGFKRQAKPLWVPESAGENNAVVVTPEVTLTWLYEAAKERFKEANKDNPKKRGRLHRSAHFAGLRAVRDFLERINKYSFDATQEMVRIGKGIDPSTGKFDLDLIAESPIADEAVKFHLVKCEMFNGANAKPAKPFKRRWLQQRWKWQLGEALERADDFYERQNADNKQKLVFESYQMEWSRKNYWNNFLVRYYQANPELKPNTNQKDWRVLKPYMLHSEPFFEIYDPSVVLDRPQLPFDDV